MISMQARSLLRGTVMQPFCCGMRTATQQGRSGCLLRCVQGSLTDVARVPLQQAQSLPQQPCQDMGRSTPHAHQLPPRFSLDSTGLGGTARLLQQHSTSRSSLDVGQGVRRLAAPAAQQLGQVRATPLSQYPIPIPYSQSVLRTCCRAD